MNIDEFELRWRVYDGLDWRFGFGWTEEEKSKLIPITDQGNLEKKLQDTSPDELKKLTLDTYSSYKKEFLAKKGSEKLTFGTMQEYIDRMEYELKVIKSMGFESYMLVVQDFVIWAKKNEIAVGPGRGSGAGSIVAWTLRITDPDPLEFGLLFERFLNPARVSPADFDIDFDDENRERVITYVKDKYGRDKVCAIGTFMKMATKAAFKDVARVLGIPFDKSNYISNIFPEKGSIAEALEAPSGENEELKTLYRNDEVLQQAMEFGGKLEGNIRQLGVHACGVIIAPEKIINYTPVQYINDDPEMGIVSQYENYGSLEPLGLIKMDFLGLRNLSIIRNAIKIIKVRSLVGTQNIASVQFPKEFQKFLDTMTLELPLDDKETYAKVFENGDTTGIFQFESGGMRRFLVQLKADRFDDIIAMSALYRPGPMEYIPTYIKRKHGEEAVDYMLPELKAKLLKKYDEKTVEDEKRKLTEDLGPIMDVTYGIAVYQEQLMFLVQSMAGFSLPEADLLRRGVGKKKMEIIEQMKILFKEKCQKFREYKPETAVIIYEKMIEPAASYSFNKSHAVCYSLIAYQTAYLKAHYPLAFYAALLRSVEEDTDKLSFFIDEVYMHGLEVRPPDVNISFNHVAAVEDHVRLGFLSIKGLGSAIGEAIQLERNTSGKFVSLEDFLKRCKSAINKKSLEGLIKSGALDEFGDRKTMIENIKQLLDWSSASDQMEGGLFGMDSVATDIVYRNVFEISFLEKLMMDFSMYKTFVSGHPFDGLYPYLKRGNFLSQVKDNEEFGQFVLTVYIKKITRAKKKGFFIMIEDVTASMEFFVSDKLDFKLFDILIISGYKMKYFSFDEMIKVSLEDLRGRATKARKLDPSRTAVRVKAKRDG